MRLHPVDRVAASVVVWLILRFILKLYEVYIVEKIEH